MAYEDQKPPVYNNPHEGQPGSYKQLAPWYWKRKALIDAVKEQYFGQLANSMQMPLHYGKHIKQLHYVPMLDDRNINDQGIDATGSIVANEVTIEIIDPHGCSRFAVGKGSNAATALTAAKKEAIDIFKNLNRTFASYDALKTALTGAGWEVVENDAVNASGNLYGSSKDIGTIVGNLPVIGELGGRVNRVGFTRVELEATMAEFGFFREYTKESMDFDNDPSLREHIYREMLRGASEITEDMLQIDLINGAGCVYYCGSATSDAELTGEEGAEPSEITYDDLVRLETKLNENLCPKNTKIITGTRMIDTKTIDDARYVYIGPEVKKTLLKMKDFHGNQAFIPVRQYGAATQIARGEIGSINHFRFIEVPEMTHWDGIGANVTKNNGYYEHNGKYNVYPMLIVGGDSFTTIGFQSGKGGGSKFKMMEKKPGEQTMSRDDPYGKLGIQSIQWYENCLVA